MSLGLPSGNGIKRLPLGRVDHAGGAETAEPLTFSNVSKNFRELAVPAPFGHGLRLRSPAPTAKCAEPASAQQIQPDK